MSEKNYAIFQTGGKQYCAVENNVCTIDKLEGNPGDKIEFTNVVLSVSSGKGDLGAPYVKNAKVVAEIVDQVKGPKINAFNYKAKKNQRKKWGHRQDLTKVKIVELVGNK